MKSFIIRFLLMIVGLTLFALGIVITIKANVGYAPWDVFHAGLANTIGLSFGTISILVGIVILVINSLFREKLGLGTILNIVLIGVFIDIIFLIDFIPTINNPVIGIAVLLLGLLIISLGSYFYIKSAFGAGPRDNLMIILARKTKIPIGICRSIIELLVTIIGWILGGMVGIGTLISVIGIGFCIQITFKILKFDVTSVKHESIIDTFKNLFTLKRS